MIKIKNSLKWVKMIENYQCLEYSMITSHFQIQIRIKILKIQKHLIIIRTRNKIKEELP